MSKTDSNDFAAISEPQAPEPAANTASRFNLDAATAEARAELDRVRANIESLTKEKAAAQAAINSLREEEKALTRFISAATPRTRKSSK